MPVSAEEVIWCYRLLLGREPETDSVLTAHMSCRDRDELVRGFLNSSEFTDHLKLNLPRVPLDETRLVIDKDANPEQLLALIEKIRLAWWHLGVTRPHFSVLTDPRFLPDKLHQFSDVFWGSGENEALCLEGVLRRFSMDQLSTLTCVEYGCGVGRVTAALGRRFRRVHAYDISPAHLALADEHLRRSGVHNARLHSCSEEVLNSLEYCDFFYSCIVLQHNPPPVIQRLVENALKSLNRGGIAMFQLPTYKVGYSFRLEEYLNADIVLDMEMHCLSQQTIFELVAVNGCSMLEIREDNWTGRPDIFVSNTFIVRRPL